MSELNAPTMCIRRLVLHECADIELWVEAEQALALLLASFEKFAEL